MRYQEIITILLLGFCLSSCGWNLNAPDDGNGGSDPDSTANFRNASSNLPDVLSNTSTKARAGDIDQDGDLDIVVAVAMQANKILMNDGSGSFTDGSSRILAQSNDSWDVSIADLNSDGNLDLFFVGNQDQTNELYINDGSGSFSDLSNRIPVTGNTTAIEALDIDSDGTTDLMLGNLGQNVILINSGNAFFNNQTTQRLPQIADATRDIAFGDITGDNLRDIIIGNDNGNRVFINTGSGFFSNQTSNRIPFANAIEETRDVNIADVDGDGDRDIYFGNTGFQNGSNPQDRLLINSGQGFFADQTTDQLPAITTNTFDAEFADLDQDGDFDLVVGNYDGGIRVLINNGSGFFSDQTGAWIPENFAPLVMDIEIAPLNNDSLLDIYISVRNGRDQLLIRKQS
jgi:hypothetical protein